MYLYKFDVFLRFGCCGIHIIWPWRLKKLGCSKKVSAIGLVMDSRSYAALNNCVSVLTVQPEVALDFTHFWGCCIIHLLSHGLLMPYLYMLNSSAWRQLLNMQNTEQVFLLPLSIIFQIFVQF